MAKYTTRIYVMVAEVLAQLPIEIRQPAADKFAEVFAADNEKFDEDLFAKACVVMK